MSLNIKISGFIDEYSESLDDQIKLLNELGEHYMCPRVIDYKNIADYTYDEFMSNIKPRLDKAGIKFSSIGSPIGKINYDDEEGFIRQKNQLKELIKIAKSMGTKYIRIFSFYYGSENPNDIYEIVIKKLREFLSIAKGTGVILMHENEKLIYGDTSDRCLKLYEALKDDGLVLCYDASNYIQCDEDPIEAFYKTVKYIKYIHVKDCSKWKVEVPLTFGLARYDLVLKRLNEMNYDGFMTLEPHTWKYAEWKKKIYSIKDRNTDDDNHFEAFKLIDKNLGVDDLYESNRKEMYVLQYNKLKGLLKAYE